jgi:hypothetical protein
MGLRGGRDVVMGGLGEDLVLPLDAILDWLLSFEFGGGRLYTCYGYVGSAWFVKQYE